MQFWVTSQCPALTGTTTVYRCNLKIFLAPDCIFFYHFALHLMLQMWLKTRWMEDQRFQKCLQCETEKKNSRIGLHQKTAQPKDTQQKMRWKTFIVVGLKSDCWIKYFHSYLIKALASLRPLMEESNCWRTELCVSNHSYIMQDHWERKFHEFPHKSAKTIRFCTTVESSHTNTVESKQSIRKMDSHNRKTGWLYPLVCKNGTCLVFILCYYYCFPKCIWQMLVPISPNRSVKNIFTPAASMRKTKRTIVFFPPYIIIHKQLIKGTYFKNWTLIGALSFISYLRGRGKNVNIKTEDA